MKKKTNIDIKQWALSIIDSVETVFFGKRDVIEKILIAVISMGHVLLEDVPGVGKTILARAIAASIGGNFARIQCTPDLLPADIIGVSIFNPKTSSFKFHSGPVFNNVVLVDEINRATPRTQSALLEAMGEYQVSVEGTNLSLPKPFFIIATENPIEFEGTFPLPESQKDRFFISLKIGYPPKDAEENILESQRRISHPVIDIKPVTDLKTILNIQSQTVQTHVDDSIKAYIMELVEKTRNNSNIQLGVSPRGSLALYRASQSLAVIRGRDYVIPEDIKELACPVFSKRIILKSDCLIKGITSENVINEILDITEVPGLKGAL